MKKFFWAALIAALAAGASPLAASPWSQNPTYKSKAKGKLGYGLKNSLLGWTAIFIEPYQPKYGKPWEGFCVGIAQSVFYTASGLIQLVTFPIPVDFPDVGRGIHIPEAEKKYGYKKKPGAAEPAAAPPAAKTVPAPVPTAAPAPPPGNSEKEAAISEALEAAAAKNEYPK